ncbi:MAG TPA: glycosyltransferase family 4 protein [Chitinophagaceae bacterium]
MNDLKKKIKVLYVQEPAGGGSLIALYEMLRELDAREIEPVVVCHYKSKYTQQLENIPGCRVLYVQDSLKLHAQHFKFSKNRWLNVICIQYNAFKKYFYHDRDLVKYFTDIFQREKPDIVHHNNDIAVNRSSIRAGVNMKIPQVLYNHGLPSYKFNFVDYVIDSFLVKKISYHIHLTQAIHNRYRKLFHSAFSNSEVIHSFIDRQVFKPSGPVDCIKKEFGIENDDIVITDVGRIIYWKGQHVLIEALNMIKNDFPKLKVLMVGSSEKGVGSEDYYNHLKKLMCQYQLHDKIIFTGNRTDIAGIMNASDVVVHTAVKPEPQGIVILEALLCKKRVIASDDAGSAELIKKYGGILFQPGNAAQLAQILLKLFKDKNGKIEIETSYPYNYKQMNSDFNSSCKARQITDIYKSCVQKV